MKLVFITDLHFGARSNSNQFDNHFRKFYEEQFFPYLLENNIENVICLGDTFDVRKNINLDILKNCKEYFFDMFDKINKNLYMIVGNHDAHFKDTLSVNTPDLVLREYERIKIISKPEIISFDDVNLLLMPWICRDNAEKSMNALENANAEYCLGHFEIAGFKMYKNTESHGGFDPIIFNRFKKTFSGHYHTRSTQGRINYLGAPYEMNWADYDDPKGFHLFDTETGNLEFVENKFKMFMIHNYDESSKEIPDCKDKVIRVVTKNVENKVKFDRFITSIQEMNPVDLKIVDEDTIVKIENDSDEISSEDTISVLSLYVDSIENSLQESGLEKDKLKSMLKNLYREAQELE